MPETRKTKAETDRWGISVPVENRINTPDGRCHNWRLLLYLPA